MKGLLILVIVFVGIFFLYYLFGHLLPEGVKKEKAFKESHPQAWFSILIIAIGLIMAVILFVANQ